MMTQEKKGNQEQGQDPGQDQVIENEEQFWMLFSQIGMSMKNHIVHIIQGVQLFEGVQMVQIGNTIGDQVLAPD